MDTSIGMTNLETLSLRTGQDDFERIPNSSEKFKNEVDVDTYRVDSKKLVRWIP